MKYDYKKGLRTKRRQTKMVRCPECKSELLKLPASIKGEKRNIYIHPEDIYNKCPYRNDGVMVTIEVVDQILCEKFQEIIENQNPLMIRWIEKIKESFIKLSSMKKR